MSDTEEGDHLLARLERDGLSIGLTNGAFVSTEDFWAPWCVALEGNEITAIAFAARLGPLGAECGVYTLPEFRGRGLAPTLAAAWAGHGALADRKLFYSTTVNNHASIAVARRLGLRRLGSSVRVI